ncbi:MAG TPA: M67 family metallopeptidase [Ilumatobacteraceae bacterium]|jgi:proteasome lid subunit RPN8/RPN11
MLAVSLAAHAGMVAHAYDCYPEEACGLLVGHPQRGTVVRFVPCENVTHSAKVYSIAPKALMRAEREAEDDGLEIIGVMHSHTYTEPYPSPTDVAQAPDPTWHYIIVSLKREAPEVRSYRLVDGTISEEALAVG